MTTSPGRGSWFRRRSWPTSQQFALKAGEQEPGKGCIGELSVAVLDGRCIAAVRSDHSSS